MDPLPRNDHSSRHTVFNKYNDRTLTDAERLSLTTGWSEKYKGLTGGELTTVLENRNRPGKNPITSQNHIRYKSLKAHVAAVSKNSWSVWVKRYALVYDKKFAEAMCDPDCKDFYNQWKQNNSQATFNWPPPDAYAGGRAWDGRQRNDPPDIIVPWFPMSYQGPLVEDHLQLERNLTHVKQKRREGDNFRNIRPRAAPPIVPHIVPATLHSTPIVPAITPIVPAILPLTAAPTPSPIVPAILPFTAVQAPPISSSIPQIRSNSPSSYSTYSTSSSSIDPYPLDGSFGDILEEVTVRRTETKETARAADTEDVDFEEVLIALGEDDAEDPEDYPAMNHGPEDWNVIFNKVKSYYYDPFISNLDDGVKLFMTNMESSNDICDIHRLLTSDLQGFFPYYVRFSTFKAPNEPRLIDLYKKAIVKIFTKLASLAIIDEETAITDDASLIETYQKFIDCILWPHSNDSSETMFKKFMFCIWDYDHDINEDNFKIELDDENNPLNSIAINKSKQQHQAFLKMIFNPRIDAYKIDYNEPIDDTSNDRIQRAAASRLILFLNFAFNRHVNDPNKRTNRQLRLPIVLAKIKSTPRNMIAFNDFIRIFVRPDIPQRMWGADIKDITFLIETVRARDYDEYPKDFWATGGLKLITALIRF